MAQANAEEGPWSEFKKALEQDNTREAKKLFKNKTVQAKNPLEIVLRLKKNKILAALLQQNINVNKSCCPYFNTPLHLAALSNNLTIICHQFLLFVSS